MESIKNFSQLTEHLSKQSIKLKVVVVCANDSHSEYAIHRALKEGFVEFTLIGDSNFLEKFPALKAYSDNITMIHVDDPDEAARMAVKFVKEGKADLLMKGIINTDNLLRAILDKENGILPQGNLLTHLAVIEIPTYHKLLFFTDSAVIPYPTLEQRVTMIKYAINACNSFGIEKPKVALINFTEKINPKFPTSIDYVEIVKMCNEGVFGNAIVDGPQDTRTACEKESGDIKGISSPVDGDADVLIFPNIEAANTFYKSVSLFAKAEMAGVLQGTVCPVVLTSRSDTGLSKYYSLCMACLQACSKKL
ncbi:MAG: phosphate acyltransferase [Bacteroides sp.]|nr:phosphate acyltransferase [Bacteroides sp.]